MGWLTVLAVSPCIKSAFVAKPWTLPFPLSNPLWIFSDFREGKEYKAMRLEGSQQQGDLEVLMPLGD